MVKTAAILMVLFSAENTQIYWASTESVDKYVKKHDMILIKFWGTWCPICIKNFDKTLSVARNYPKAKFLLIAISDNEYDLRKFVKGKIIPSNVLITMWRGRTPVKTTPNFWIYYKGKKILEAKSINEVKKKLITSYKELQ